MRSQAEKGTAFRALHHRNQAFIIPNPWDVGSARLLAKLGYEALATTSAGYAFSIGQKDGTVDRGAMMEHIAALVAATDLPVSADLENGFSEDLSEVAETYRLASAAGLVGASIEDVGRPHSTLYSLEEATDRVRAAVETVRSFPYQFTLTARAENFIAGNPDLKDTIRRLQAYQDAGADVLYAPGLTRKEDIEELVRSVDRPVNVLMGLSGVRLTRDELSNVGVKRISVGSALSRAAYGAFLNASREMLEKGTFRYADVAVSYKEISELFG